MKGALIAVCGGLVLAALGVGMCFWLEVVHNFSTDYPAYGLLDEGFMPVYVCGLLLLAGGCVALGFESAPRRCYQLAVAGLMGLPVALGIVHFEWLDFSLDWSILVMVGLAVIFALGLMFGVLGVSRRRFV